MLVSIHKILVTAAASALCKLILIMEVFIFVQLITMLSLFSSAYSVLVQEWLERVVAAMGLAFVYDPLSSFGVSVNLLRSGKGVISMSELFFDMNA